MSLKNTGSFKIGLLIDSVVDCTTQIVIAARPTMLPYIPTVTNQTNID